MGVCHLEQRHDPNHQKDTLFVNNGPCVHQQLTAVVHLVLDPSRTPKTLFSGPLHRAPRQREYLSRRPLQQIWRETELPTQRRTATRSLGFVTVELNCRTEGDGNTGRLLTSGDFSQIPVPRGPAQKRPPQLCSVIPSGNWFFSLMPAQNDHLHVHRGSTHGGSKISQKVPKCCAREICRGCCQHGARTVCGALTHPFSFRSDRTIFRLIVLLHIPSRLVCLCLVLSLEVRTCPPTLRVGNSKKYVLGGYLDGQGWLQGPSKGLEGRKIGDDIILRRLLKMGNLGTKLVT